MDIHGIDHVEFYVRDPDGAAARFCETYGFLVHGLLGPQTGLPDRRSVLVRQGEIQVLFTGALTGEHPAAGYVARHGDGLATIALATDDPEAALAEAVDRGASPLPPAPPMGP